MLRGGNWLSDLESGLYCPGINKCQTKTSMGVKATLCCCQNQDFCNTASIESVQLWTLLLSATFTYIFVRLYWNNLLLNFFSLCWLWIVCYILFCNKRQRNMFIWYLLLGSGSLFQNERKQKTPERTRIQRENRKIQERENEKQQ